MLATRISSSNNTAGPIIRTVGVTKNYTLGKQRVSILHNVSLEVFEGEFIALMGPSGSGKSTLMNVLGCLDIASSGDYYLNGVNVANETDDRLAEIRNQNIGFVFQTFNLLPKLTALENVALPSLYSTDEHKERAIELMKKVGLGDRLHHRPGELSGGQRQRVAIARALLMNPPILFADEPTGNLDSKSGAEVMAIFRKLSDEGKTIIMVTHDVNIASNAHRIVRLKDGYIEG